MSHYWSSVPLLIWILTMTVHIICYGILRLVYRTYPAIRQGFCRSRMTSNYKTSPMKFCYNTNFTLPKQSQRSRSVLQDRSRSLGLFWKEKTLSYNRINTVPFYDVNVKVPSGIL